MQDTGMDTDSDFVDVISGLTQYVQNERVRAYNEGVDTTIGAVKQWMIDRHYRVDGDRISDILACLMRQLDHADGE
jgi:hypothetical protein